MPTGHQVSILPSFTRDFCCELVTHHHCISGAEALATLDKEQRKR